jgi:hypothetical protein
MRGRPTVTFRRRRGRAPVAALALGLAVAAGCGGTAELKLPGPDSTTPPLTKVQFTVQANEICRATTKAIAERTDATGTGNLDATAGGDRQKLKEAVEPINRLALSRLRNLTPPAADADLVHQGLDALQSAVDAIDRDPQAPLDAVGLERPELFDYGLTGCFSKR